jgi:outer membrane protein assembly factor BamB
LKWNVDSGEGILWKVEVGLPGNNSAVVWKDRLFVTGADKSNREVYCFDISGKLLWKKPVPSTAEPPEVNEDTGRAASTAATDGRRVYVIFSTGDLAAFDFAGNAVWTRSLGVPKNSYGHAASLCTYRNLLIVPFDQGSAKDKISKLMALDTATGKTVWETPRQVPSCWTTPIVFSWKGKPQLLTAADPFAISYDPLTGKEIWRAKCLRQDVGPSPTFVAGSAILANEYPGMSGVPVDGQGDVTDKILWRAEDNAPDTSSPLATDEFAFTLATYGVLTCCDIKTGEKLWEAEFDDTNFNSSASLAAGRIYVFSLEGKCWALEATREKCKRLAESKLGEKCVASPAFQDGRIYIRGEKHLFCLGGKE